MNELLDHIVIVLRFLEDTDEHSEYVHSTLFSQVLEGDIKGNLVFFGHVLSPSRLYITKGFLKYINEIEYESRD